jgi:predicted CXXCH cytochrome family protein
MPMSFRGLKVLGFIVFLVAGSAQAAGISGTPHDLTMYWATDEVCRACHTPHNAKVAVPLWNHTMSTATYSLYQSPTSNAIADQPGPNSKLCLSCHDGTVGISDFGGSWVGPGGITFGPGDSGYIGTALQNDHPVGIVYDTALATSDGALADPTTTAVTIGSAKTKTGTIATTMLANGKVECTTCHDVHNIYTVGTGGLVTMSMQGSALCLQCHKK